MRANERLFNIASHPRPDLFIAFLSGAWAAEPELLNQINDVITRWEEYENA